MPIEIEVDPMVTAHPSRLFLGVVRKPATRSVQLWSPLGPVIVEQASAEHKILSVNIVNIDEGTVLKAALTPQGKSETLRRHVTVKCKMGEHREDLTIPYSVLVRPEEDN